MEDTFGIFKNVPLDFSFAAALNTRFENASFLRESNAARFGLVTDRARNSAIPYWRYRSMCCTEAGRMIKELHQKMLIEKVALDCSISLDSFCSYRQDLLDDLLDCQYALAAQHPVLDRILDWVDHRIQRSLERDVERFSAVQSPQRTECL